MRLPVKLNPHHARRDDLGKRFRANQAAALVQGIATAMVHPAPFEITNDVSHSGLDDSPSGRRRQIKQLYFDPLPDAVEAYGSRMSGMGTMKKMGGMGMGMMRSTSGMRG